MTGSLSIRLKENIEKTQRQPVSDDDSFIPAAASRSSWPCPPASACGVDRIGSRPCQIRLLQPFMQEAAAAAPMQGTKSTGQGSGSSLFERRLVAGKGRNTCNLLRKESSNKAAPRSGMETYTHSLRRNRRGRGRGRGRHKSRGLCGISFQVLKSRTGISLVRLCTGQDTSEQRVHSKRYLLVSFSAHAGSIHSLQRTELSSASTPDRAALPSPLSCPRKSWSAILQGVPWPGP